MRRAAWLVLALVLAAGPARAQAEPFDHRGLAVAFLERYIRPGAQTFAERAAVLRDRLAALCERPAPATLAEARAAFAGAVLAYGRVEAVRFGPSREASRQERLVLYPDPKGLVRRQVDKALAARDKSVLEPDLLHGKSVALQGFPALELLLHGEGAAGLAAAGEAQRFRCLYARSAGANIARLAREIAAGWSDPAGYAQLMLEPSPHSPVYLSEGEVTLEIVQAFLNGLETLRDVRLAAPAGLRDPDKAPSPALLEISGLALPLAGADLAGLLALWREGGLEARAARHDRPIATLIGEELARAEGSLAGLEGGLVAARQDGPARQAILALGFPLKNARQLAAQLLAEAAQLSVGFNAGDGD